MVSSYPLPEGFSDFDVFSLGSCLLVEGECCHFVLELSPNTASLRGLRYSNLRADPMPPRSPTVNVLGSLRLHSQTFLQIKAMSGKNVNAAMILNLLRVAQ